MINKFKPMECPVCHKYYFTEDTKEEKNENDYSDKQDDYCSFCGWKYDLYQSEHPDVANMTNELSLEEYRINYELKIKLDSDYDYLKDNNITHTHACPVCGKYNFNDIGSFEICPYCGWQDDDLMEKEPDKWGGNSNDLCLNEYKERYKKSLNKKKNN